MFQLQAIRRPLQRLLPPLTQTQVRHCSTHISACIQSYDVLYPLRTNCYLAWFFSDHCLVVCSKCDEIYYSTCKAKHYIVICWPLLLLPPPGTRTEDALTVTSWYFPSIHSSLYLLSCIYLNIFIHPPISFFLHFFQFNLSLSLTVALSFTPSLTFNHSIHSYFKHSWFLHEMQISF